MKPPAQSVEALAAGRAANGERENGQPWGIDVHAHESFGPSFKKSWQVEVELHGSLLPKDIEEFQQQIRRAFQACAQAIDDELARSSGSQVGSLALGLRPTGGNGARPKVGSSNEEAVEQLVSDLLSNGEDGEHLQAGGTEELAATSEPTAPPVPAAKKTLVGAKKPAAPPAKTKPKPSDDDETWPRVSVKYWGTLGVLAVIMAAYLVWPSGAHSPASLANQALTARDGNDRLAAIGELSLHQEKDVLPAVRRVAAESNDPEVRIKAFEILAIRHDAEGLAVVMNSLDDESSAVRLQALKSAAILAEVAPELIDFREEDPAGNHAQAAKNLREIIAKRKRDGEESLAKMKARTPP